MTHLELFPLALKFHAGVSALAFTGLFRYFDRTESFKSAHQGFENLLSRIRLRISAKLAASLTRVFEDARQNPSPILGADGASYTERPTDPIQSEAYLECVREFVQDDDDVLVHLRELISARDNWLMWAKTASWSLVLCLFWEVFAVACVTVGEHCNYPTGAYENMLIWVSFAPSALVALGFLLSLVGQLRAHDRLMGLRKHYDAP